MALPDTARLIASLELQDKFSKTASTFDRTVGGMERRVSTFSRIGGQVSSGLQSAATNLTRIGIAGAGLLTVAVTNGIRELERLELATAQTNAVIESTGGAAGQTAEEVRNLAEKFEGLNATIDDKVIQSAENMLLTFTNVQEKAFEPALQAILDVNTAMGGGEEGLQGVAIQVGKALNDPIRGLTALRRIGVSFSQTQEDQIKALVKANDLYGAQEIILAELAKEFGGSFAAAGDTAAGKFAKVKDAVEDAQAALATAFLPVLEKVADKLGTFLADPATVQRIQDFGGDLAAGFEKVLDTASKLDFAAIGSALTIAGTGAKAVFDAFTGLPPWIQTAVLTGWGLNKLTGGALTGIAGTLTKALVGGGFGGRGTTPLNPLFVSAVGGGLGGAPVAGGGSLLGTVAKFVIGPAAAVIIGSEIAAALNNPKIQPAIDFEQNQLKAVVDSQDLDRIVDGLNAIEAEQNTDDILAQTALIASNIPFIGDALGHVGPQLEKDRQVLLDQLEQMGLTREQAEQIVAEQKALTEKYGTEATKQINAVNALNIPLGLGNVFAQQIKDKAEATIQKNAAILDSLRGQAGSLIRIAEKNFSPTVRVNVQATSYLSLRTVAGALTSYRISAGGLTGGFTESAESIY